MPMKTGFNFSNKPHQKLKRLPSHLVGTHQRREETSLRKLKGPSLQTKLCLASNSQKGCSSPSPMINSSCRHLLAQAVKKEQRHYLNPQGSCVAIHQKRKLQRQWKLFLHQRGAWGDSAPATATPSTSKVRCPLVPEQRYIHQVKYCEGARPKNQLEASKQQHRNLCHHLSRASAQVTFHTILFDEGRVIYTPHTLEPLKGLGLDTHRTTKLALKLHALSSPPVNLLSPDMAL
eukprot:1145631-Pelagomonas_calceolata.AAC.17